MIQTCFEFHLRDSGSYVRLANVPDFLGVKLQCGFFRTQQSPVIFIGWDELANIRNQINTLLIGHEPNGAIPGKCV